MNKLEATILPYFFAVLFGFIILNLLMNICLYSFSKIKNVKMLSWYWGSLLLTFIFQGFFQSHQLAIILSYGVNVIPSVIMAVILYDIMNKKAPLNFFFVSWLVAIFVTPVLNGLDFSFTVTALPLSVAMALVPLRAAQDLLINGNQKTSNLQKFMGCLLILAATHFINFAFFRMEPGNQIWGWAVALGLYQVFSVLLIALVLEDQSGKESERLQAEVAHKTEELQSTLALKEAFFRMIHHDIANPLQSQFLLISMIQRNREKIFEKPNLLNQLAGLNLVMKKVIEQVRSLEALNSGKVHLEVTPICFEKCRELIFTVFEHHLEEKKLKLEFVNDLSPGTLFLADLTIFTTSVLGNLVSNAIKFSPPHSVVTVHAFEKEGRVVIEVSDQGIGMPKEMAYDLFNPLKSSSRQGTLGESGTGFGLYQVKSYMDHFGGSIDVQSEPMQDDFHPHGTRISLSLEKSPSGSLH